DRMLVELLLGTGMRIGSALAIDVGDLDFAHGEIALRTTKDDRPSSAVMTTAIAKKLKTFLGARTEGPVFIAGDHGVSMRDAQRQVATSPHEQAQQVDLFIGRHGAIECRPTRTPEGRVELQQPPPTTALPKDA